MEKALFFGVVCLFFLCSIVKAQIPDPVIETEMRDSSSVRRRTFELERVKRDADKMRPEESAKEREFKLAEIKEDFEDIQKLQTLIIKAYTTGEKVNYGKISDAAFEMTKKAARLDENLFDSRMEKIGKNTSGSSAKSKSVRDLIIQLDNSIGVFVDSPIFKNTKLVDPKTSEEARLILEKIFKLSEMLSKEAKRTK